MPIMFLSVRPKSWLCCFLVFLLFYGCSLTEYLQEDDLTDDKRCNTSMPVQMVELKFSSHTVKNGE